MQSSPFYNLLQIFLTGPNHIPTSLIPFLRFSISSFNFSFSCLNFSFSSSRTLVLISLIPKSNLFSVSCEECLNVFILSPSFRHLPFDLITNYLNIIKTPNPLCVKLCANRAQISIWTGLILPTYLL